MIKRLLFSFLILSVLNSFGCCGAGKFRLFPIGSSNGKIVVATFDMHRKCTRGKMFKQFEWEGVAKLAYFQGDSLNLIEVVDTFSFSQTNHRDTTINLLNQFYDSIIVVYDKVFKRAVNNLKKFIPALPENYIRYYDSLENKKQFTFNDSILNYNDKFILNTEQENLCGLDTEIIDVRGYYILDKRIFVLSLTCKNNRFYERMKPTNNQENFKKLDKAYTVSQVQWHGSIKDKIFIENL